MYTLIINLNGRTSEVTYDDYDTADDRLCAFLNNNHDEVEIFHRKTQGSWTTQNNNTKSIVERSEGNLFLGYDQVGSFTICRDW